jgi:hypothetical protein
MEEEYTKQNNDQALNLEGLSKRYWGVCQYIKKWDHTSVEERLMITEILKKIFEITVNPNLKIMISRRAKKLSVRYAEHKEGRLE